MSDIFKGWDSGKTSGVWTDYTPTVTYSGGSTDPTSETKVYAKYIKFGGIVFFRIRYTFVVGGGDRTVTIFTLPSAGAGSITPFSAIESITSALFTNCASYLDATATYIRVAHRAMASNGAICVSGFYEAA